MAYVDLMSTGVTPVSAAAGTTQTYNFSYDTPIAADGSPNLTHIGFQINALLGANWAGVSTLGRLINSWRIKIGANTILDFNDPAPAGRHTGQPVRTMSKGRRFRCSFTCSSSDTQRVRGRNDPTLWS